MTAGRTTAQVVAPPPLLFLGIVGGAVILELLWPSAMLAGVAPLARWLAGAILAVLAILLASPGARAFRRAGTPVKPWQPTSALVTDGIFGRLRNPMYVGLVLLALGLALLTASAWLLVLSVPLALVLHYGVVLREEAYLEARFGDAYRAYKAAVPRYGIGR